MQNNEEVSAMVNFFGTYHLISIISITSLYNSQKPNRTITTRKVLTCICSVLNSILSKPRRGVSEAEEMLVTQMSNVAGNEIASPSPR